MWNGWLEDAEKLAYMRYYSRIRAVKALPLNDEDNRCDRIESVLCEAIYDANISVPSFVSLCVNAYAR